MKLTRPQHCILVLTSLVIALTPSPWVNAGTFEQQEVSQSDFVAIARPYSQNKYDLLIIQQLPNGRQCWSENGANPVTVEPLLLNFDFTGSCERSTDSNGYSLRVEGQDYGLDYLLRIVERNGELLLVATHRKDSSVPEVVVGRSYGMGPGLIKIVLNPGWRFTKRVYQGQVLGHVYLTGDTQGMIASSKPLPPVSETPNNNNSNPSETVQEFTFTAPTSAPPPNKANPPENPVLPENNTFESEPPPESSDSSKPEYNFTPPSSQNNSNTLPPPPLSSLPQISPPSNSDSNIVPPPSPTAVSNAQRKSLTDTINTLNGTGPVTPTSPNPQVAQASSFKVLVSARTQQQQQQLKSLYPDAFPAAYNGQSFWQVGVFSTRDNAESALNGVKNIGLNGRIIPF